VAQGISQTGPPGIPPAGPHGGARSGPDTEEQKGRRSGTHVGTDTGPHDGPRQAPHAAGTGDSPAARSFRPGRDVRLLWSACAADAVGSNASGIVLPLVLLGFGYSAAVVGVVAGACTAAGLLVAPLVAWPADRGARKAVMFWSAVVSALAMAVLALSLARGRPSLTLLLGAMLVECVAAACYKAAAPGTVVLLAAPEDVPRVVAGVEAGEQGALILGPALGGVLYQLSRLLPFLVDAVSYVVTAVCVRSMRADLRPPAVDGKPERGGEPEDGGLRAGLSLVRSSPLLRLVLLWATTVNGVLAALTYQTLFALSGHGGVSMGLVLAVSGVAGLAGALAAPALVDRLGAGRVLVAVTWLLLPPAAGLAAADGSPWAFGALFASICLLLPLVSVVLQSCAVRAIPPGAQSRVAAVLTVGSGLVATLTPALTGTLAEQAGTAAPPLACAAVLLALALRTTLGGPRPLLQEPAA
jgi:predicted MFS family arabinose efflux permease